MFLRSISVIWINIRIYILHSRITNHGKLRHLSFRLCRTTLRNVRSPFSQNYVFLVVSLKPRPHVTYVSSLIKFRIENIAANCSYVYLECTRALPDQKITQPTTCSYYLEPIRILAAVDEFQKCDDINCRQGYTKFLKCRKQVAIENIVRQFIIIIGHSNQGPL